MLPTIRLIRIDGDLGRMLERPGDDFEKAHRVSLGAHRKTASEVVAQTLDLLARIPRDPVFGGYLVVDDDRGLLVGTCGFKHGPERDGSVEIAYFTFADFEGRGYATAMARALLGLALDSPAVRLVLAHTLPQRNASTRILEKVGLRRTGEIVDPEDGRIWRWEYRPPRGIV